MSITKTISKRIPFYAIAMLVSTVAYLAYDNLRLRTDMSATALNLKNLASNVSSLQKDNGKLAKKNKEISSSNKKLTTRNKALTTRLADIKSRIKARNKKVNSTTATRMAKKMATAPARMVPIVGIGLTATTTANDIHDSCTDMADIKRFEQNLFGDSEPLGTETLCGVDVERKLQESALAMEADMTTLFKSSQATYDDAYKNLGGYLHYLEERGTKSYGDFMNNTGGFINYLKEQSNPPHPKKSKVKYNETPGDFLKYLYYEHSFF